MKYRLRCNLSDVPQLVEQLVERELDVYERSWGGFVAAGEVRLYEYGHALTEPMKCCLIEAALRDGTTVCVTGIERRWTEVVRDAFRKLERDMHAVADSGSHSGRAR
jgi:hypothetical protein